MKNIDLEALEKETFTLTQAFAIIKKEWGNLKKTELNITEYLPSIDTSVQKITKEIEKLKNVESYIRALEDFCKNLQSQLEEEKAHFRTAFINGLSKEFEKQNLEIRGTFPEFKVGIVTLVFNFEQKEAALYYGPKIYSVGTTSLDITKIVEKVTALLGDLNSSLIPDQEFIKLLYTAYDRMIKRSTVESSESVSIFELLPEFVFLLQPEAFLKDPKKEHFKTYTKMHFSYNLYKLRERTYNGYELQLHIATREETKKTYAHLWVPQNERGDGVHYGGLRFKRI